MTGERITSRQDLPANQELLAAASTFYGAGKRTLAKQMALTIGLAVILSFIAIHVPDFKVFATSISVTVVWLDALFIDRLQAAYRKQGAKVQEMFDCDLFDLEWSELRAGEKLELETIHKAAEVFTEKNTGEKSRGWYPAAVAALPLPLARLLCQRACFWWETAQRRTFGVFILAIAVLLLIAIGAWGICQKQPLGDLILSVYAPLAPAVIWCIREFWRQSDAAESLSKGRSFTEKIWKRAVAGELTGGQLTRVSRQIQDALFDSRSRNPLIFNWVYNLLRSSNEKAMTEAAARMVEDALVKEDTWRRSIEVSS